MAHSASLALLVIGLFLAFMTFLKTGAYHVVCHDLTPHARQYLEDGRLDFIVDQDFSAQTTRAIEVLAHTLRTAEPPRQSIEYFHCSINQRQKIAQILL